MIDRILKTWTPWLFWMAAATLATFGVLYNWFPPPILQPVSFNHSKHKDFGCAFCHEGVETRARASLPQITLCRNCHDEPPVKDPKQVEAWNQAVQTGRFAWRRLTRIENHVYFSHRRHVALGKLECVTCHGNMADRTTPPPHALQQISMKFCTDCHAKNSVSTDCAHCHR